MSYSQMRASAFDYFQQQPNVVVRAAWFKEMVQNKGPLDLKQQGERYEAAGNVAYGLVGSSGGLAPFLHAGSAYAHVMAQWDTKPFSASNIVNEIGDQYNVTRGMAAAVVCW